MLTDEQRDAALENSPSTDRLTPELIRSKISMEKYLYPHEIGPSEAPTTTICVLTLLNGFTVVGKSACADPANFNKDLGAKIAFQDAERQIWSLEGYLLKEKLNKKAA